MYSAQITGFSFQAGAFTDEEHTQGKLIESLAKEIAQKQQHWDSIQQLRDEGATFSSKTLAGLRPPSIPRLQKANSSITSAVFNVVNKELLRLSMALQAILDEGSQPKPKTP